jgi:hypothetical protein
MTGLSVKETTEKAEARKVYSGKLWTIPEVARILRVDGTTVRRWAKLGAIEIIVLPGRPGGSRHAYRIDGATLDRLLQAQLLQPAS